MSKTALNLPDDLTTAYRPQKNSLNRISKESQKFDFWTHLVAAQKQWVNLGVQKSVFLKNIEVQQGNRANSFYIIYLSRFSTDSMSKRENPITVG